MSTEKTPLSTEKKKTPKTERVKPEAAARRKTPRKSAGDGLPVDVIGKFIAQGDIVLLGDPASEPPAVAGTVPKLYLGYIKALGKSYADVVLIAHAEDPGTKIRLMNPHAKLVAVREDSLDSKVAYFEAVKLAAAQARTY